MQKILSVDKTTMAVNTEHLSLFTSLKVQKSPEVIGFCKYLWICRNGEMFEQ